MITLRPFQTEHSQTIVKAFDDGAKRVLLPLATGTGKTTIGVEVSRLMMPKGRVIFVTNLTELNIQAVNRYTEMLGIFPAIEKAELYSPEAAWNKSPIVVASIQTLISGPSGKLRMHRFDPSEFALVIIDEAHHATSPSYRTFIDYFSTAPNVKFLGLTATPDRADEKALGQIFDSVPCEMYMREAVEQGWIVDHRSDLIQIEGLDYSKCRRTAGELNGRDLEESLLQEEPLYGMVDGIIRRSGDRPTIVFAHRVRQAALMAELINRYLSRIDNPAAVHVSGTTCDIDRQECIGGFKTGKYQYLVQVGICREGFDSPRAACVAMCSPCLSRPKYEQMLGRGTRPLPGVIDPYPDSAEDRIQAIAASDKPDLMVLDFVGNSGRHRIVNAVDIFAGEYDDEVVELAIRKARDHDGSVDPRKVLSDAEREIRDIRRRKQERRMQHMTPKAKYSVRRVSPWDVLDIVPWRVKPWDTNRKPTDPMVNCLRNFKVPNPEKLEYHAAKQLIGTLIQRRKDKKCTYKQAALLGRHGLPTDVGFEQASAWIDEVAKNSWRLPDRLRKFTEAGAALEAQPVEVSREYVPF